MFSLAYLLPGAMLVGLLHVSPAHAERMPFSPPPETTPLSTPSEGETLSPEHWPTGLLPSLAEALGTQAPWRPQPSRHGAQASNPRHGLSARFDAEGLALTTDAGDLRLAFSGIGRADRLRAPARAKAEIEGARVLYRHGPGLTQWFINSPLGLEQGFTLEHRPEGRGELQLALTLAGDFGARLDHDELLFTDPTGAARLRYGALAAFDAEGRALPARMRLDGQRLLLAVDDAGARYPVVIDPLIGGQVAKLVADDRIAYDQFGFSVALSGDTALIGANRADPDGKSEAGAAYIFVRGSNTWTQQATLTADDGAANDGFGSSVALSGDTALVGADGAPFGGTSNPGAAYVFVRSDTTWTQQAKFTADEGPALDKFGISVALSESGDTALVGAPDANDRTGAAYVFERSGTTWAQQAKLTASDGAVGDEFGNSVALSGDTALATAHGASLPGKLHAGAAYAFVRSGTTWTQQAKLTASDGAPSDYFGARSALSGDTALVGVPGVDIAGNIDIGAAYVFVRNGGTWSQQAKLTANDGAQGDWLGFSVAIMGDTALVGAAGTNSQAGAAYVFVRNGTFWSQRAKLTANDRAATDALGASVALSSDIALTGAHQANPVGVINAGAVYVFGPAVDLELIKQDSADPARHGSTLTYSLYVTNLDDEVDATGVVLTDTLPTGVGYVADDSGCSVSGTPATGETVTCALGTLAKGGTMTGTHLTVQVNAEPWTVVSNTATVSVDQPDINTDNNTDTETTSIRLPNAPPVATSLALVAYVGSPLSGTLPAADPDGDSLTYAIVTNGVKGEAVITDAATGAFTYTPNAGETGTDSFTFQASDGALHSNTATVTVTIKTHEVGVFEENGGGGLDPLLLLGLLPLLAGRRLGTMRRLG